MTEPRTEAGRRLYEAMQSAAVGVEPPMFPLPKLPLKGWPYRDAILAIEKQAAAEALTAYIEGLRVQVEGLRALIGPLDPSCAKARAETLDAVLALLSVSVSDEAKT